MDLNPFSPEDFSDDRDSYDDIPTFPLWREAWRNEPERNRFDDSD